MIIHYILGELLPLVFFVCTGTFVGVSAGRSYGRRRDRRAKALAKARADEYSHSFLKDEDREYFETWDRILSIHTRPEPAPERTPPPGGGGVSAPKGGSGQSHADVGSSFYDRGISKAVRDTDQEAFERKWDAEARAKGYNVPARNISIDRCTGDAKVVEPKSRTHQERRAENEQIAQQIAQQIAELRKLHLDVKARDLAVSSDDSPEEKLRKLREYRRSRSQAQYGITPRSTDS